MTSKKYVSDINSLLEEWDYELNTEAKPEDVLLHSNKKCYWKCNKGHPSYLATATKRVRGDGCPVCSNHKIVKGINDFMTENPDLIEEWDWNANDSKGIKPESISSGSGKKAYWRCKTCGGSWEASIVNRAKKHSGCPYCANLKVLKGYNDLATVRPKLAEEWDYDKNGDLTPDDIVAFSAKKIWWKCHICKNSWQSTPNQRTKTSCPYCSNHKIVPGYNDFESQHPELMCEWDFDKNSTILPSQVASGSEKKVWWKCDKGHSWMATINSRAAGRGCPYCTNQKVLTGFNDFLSLHPELRDEWDYEKNEDCRPEQYTEGSTHKVWWKCPVCNKSWKTSIHQRTIGHSCPKCGVEKNKVNRLRTYAQKNPLFDNYPELKAEWDFEKNKSIDLSLIAASSNSFAWWKCSKGHSFRTRISTRTLKGVGCPYCSNQLVLFGTNDLQTLNPNLASEWDYDLNGGLKPSDVLSHSSKSVWWKCPVCNKSWKAKVNNRANGRGCPNCMPEGTSFIEQTLYYYIKKAFNDAENRHRIGKLEFDIYIPSENLAIEYDGAYYHTGEKSVARENKKNSFCEANNIKLIRLREKPLAKSVGAINIECDCSTWSHLEETCRNMLSYLNSGEIVDVSISNDYLAIIASKVRKKKSNSIAIQYPELLKEWDYDKNVRLNPEEYSKGSRVKVWWKCEKGHSWMAAIANRCNGTGCPECFNERRKQGLNRK